LITPTRRRIRLRSPLACRSGFPRLSRPRSGLTAAFGPPRHAYFEFTILLPLLQRVFACLTLSNGVSFRQCLPPSAGIIRLWSNGFRGPTRRRQQHLSVSGCQRTLPCLGPARLGRRPPSGPLPAASNGLTRGGHRNPKIVSRPGVLPQNFNRAGRLFRLHHRPPPGARPRFPARLGVGVAFLSRLWAA